MEYIHTWFIMKLYVSFSSHMASIVFPAIMKYNMIHKYKYDTHIPYAYLTYCSDHILIYIYIYISYIYNVLLWHIYNGIYMAIMYTS